MPTQNWVCLKIKMDDWLVVLGFNATLTAKVISWRSLMHLCFLVFLSPVLTQLLFPKPLTTFLTCFCRGERRKYAGKKSRLNRGSNSQPPGLESDSLTTEPPGRGSRWMKLENQNNTLIRPNFKSTKGGLNREVFTVQ